MNADYDPTDPHSITTNFRATLVMDSLPEEPSGWRAMWRRVRSVLSNAWSMTHFGEPEVNVYAERMMLQETRRGIVMMAILSLLTQVAAIVLYQRLGAHTSFLYTYGLLALLSLHVVVSARFVDDMRALNLLGTILLIVTGVAIMTIAHRSGTINAGLMASIVLLFMVMPLVPWGLREACTIVVLTYLMFTLSSLSVGGRFETETLWTLQFLILASATTAMLIIVRNAMVRKDDIRARYDLEDAHRELQLISTRDPLTGAWNRRYLDQNFYAIARTARREGKTLQLALLDVDSFKYLNDTFGHHHGDEILRRLANIFMEHLPGNAHLLRLGGDEFAVLHSGPNFQELIGRCLKHLETDPRLLDVENGQPVLVSVGFAGLADDEWKDLEALYKRADANLYAMKERRKSA